MHKFKSIRHHSESFFAIKFRQYGTFDHLLVFGQRPRRGRSPVEHRGTFVCHSICLFILPRPSHAWNLPSQAWNLPSQAWKLPSQAWNLPSHALNLRGQISGLRGQISGPRTDFRPERADSKPERADFRPERVNFRPERAWGGDKQTDRMTNESLPVFYSRANGFCIKSIEHPSLQLF